MNNKYFSIATMLIASSIFMQNNTNKISANSEFQSEKNIWDDSGYFNLKKSENKKISDTAKYTKSFPNNNNGKLILDHKVQIESTDHYDEISVIINDSEEIFLKEIIKEQNPITAEISNYSPENKNVKVLNFEGKTEIDLSKYSYFDELNFSFKLDSKDEQYNDLFGWKINSVKVEEVDNPIKLKKFKSEISNATNPSQYKNLNTWKTENENCLDEKNLENFWFQPSIHKKEYPEQGPFKNNFIGIEYSTRKNMDNLYENTPTGNYNNGSRNGGCIISETEKVHEISENEISVFEYKIEADIEKSENYDILKGYIIDENGNQKLIWKKGDPKEDAIILNKYSGQNIKIMFKFDTEDKIKNDGQGIKIKNLGLHKYQVSKTVNTNDNNKTENQWDFSSGKSDEENLWHISNKKYQNCENFQTSEISMNDPDCFYYDYDCENFQTSEISMNDPDCFYYDYDCENFQTSEISMNADLNCANIPSIEYSNGKNYDTGNKNSGTATIKTTIPKKSILQFTNEIDVERTNNYDIAKIIVQNPQNGKIIKKIDKSHLMKSEKIVLDMNYQNDSEMKIIIKTSFDTVDGLHNDYKGWKLYDFEIISDEYEYEIEPETEPKPEPKTEIQVFSNPNEKTKHISIFPKNSMSLEVLNSDEYEFEYEFDIPKNWTAYEVLGSDPTLIEIKSPNDFIALLNFDDVNQFNESEKYLEKTKQGQIKYKITHEVQNENQKFICNHDDDYDSCESFFDVKEISNDSQKNDFDFFVNNVLPGFQKNDFGLLCNTVISGGFDPLDDADNFEIQYVSNPCNYPNHIVPIKSYYGENQENVELLLDTHFYGAYCYGNCDYKIRIFEQKLDENEYIYYFVKILDGEKVYSDLKIVYSGEKEISNIIVDYLENENESGISFLESFEDNEEVPKDQNLCFAYMEDGFDINVKYENKTVIFDPGCVDSKDQSQKNKIQYMKEFVKLTNNIFVD